MKDKELREKLSDMTTLLVGIVDILSAQNREQVYERVKSLAPVVTVVAKRELKSIKKRLGE